MAREEFVAGLDVGTTKVVCCVGGIQERGKPVQIIGDGMMISTGVKKGAVVDLESTILSIDRAVEKAERIAGVRVNGVILGIAGEHMQCFNSRGAVSLAPHSEITPQDVEKVLESSKAISLPPDHEVVHIFPKDFIVDGQDGIKNPVQLRGSRLEVETHIVTGAAGLIQNLLKSVRTAGLEVYDIIPQQIASAEAILTEEEKEVGILLADIGGGTTDIVVYYEGFPRFTWVLPIGGLLIDKDIAYLLSTSITEAERLKKEHGYALSNFSPDDLVRVKIVGEKGVREVPARVLCEIIQARCEQIFDLVRQKLTSAGCYDLIPGGVVLTGGGSLLRGIQALAKTVLNVPVRVGGPTISSGLAEQVRSPVYSTSVGLVLFGAKTLMKMPRKAQNLSSWKESYGKFFSWLKEFIKL